MYSDKQDLDKFYTKPEVVDTCLSVIDLDRYECVIEPSAGNGSFFNKIVHNNVIGLDLKPEHQGIIESDWFDYFVDMSYTNVLVIGNPPFGKRNYLSKSFLSHSFSFFNVSTVAFVLPNVYKKHTLQRIIPKRFRISHIVDLPHNSFTVNGKDYHVPCSFFVFDRTKGDDLRFDPDLYKTCPDFAFSDKNDYDFFVMGASPNVTKLSPEITNRGYYIKSFIDTNDLMDRFKSIKWTSLSSVNGGVAWRTKPELIKGYMENFPLTSYKYNGSIVFTP